MPKLRVLSGQDLVRIFNKLGFTVAAQRGSHIKLKRVASNGSTKAIYNQALKFIPEENLKQEFYV